MKDHSRMWGGILLIVGTTVGAGMLAIPVSTGLAGFIPTLACFILFWMLMTFSALCLLEVNLALHSTDTNLISMARFTLGKKGAAVTWFLYLYLLYSLTTAYLAGSGPIFAGILQLLAGIEIAPWIGMIGLLFIFGICVYKGTRAVDMANRILMGGLAAAFIALLACLYPTVDPAMLLHAEWNKFYIGLSVIATSFGFHIIIPSLAHYMHRRTKQLQQVILIGSFIPVVIYTLWEALALGIIPLDGEYGIVEGFCRGNDGAYLIGHHIAVVGFSLLANLFSICAIVTSFLGVSLSLSHFLSDGLGIEKTRRGRVLLYLLTFAPPLFFTLTNPRAFLTALEYAGTYGVVILLGFLPGLMVWRLRYKRGVHSTYRAPGGKPALLLLMIFSSVIVLIELYKVGC